MATVLNADSTADVSGTPPVMTPGPNFRVHLTYLDGMRGLAALYVLIYHAWISQATEASKTGLHGLLTNWLLYGHFAVDIFIVLSGFCLMLPVVRRGTLEGGMRTFFVRRAWRILPTFWAALVLSFGLDLLQQRVSPNCETLTLSWKAFLANALLLPDTLAGVNGINGAFWSVAVEWKIYFLFPLVVLAWRRWGVAAALGLTALIGYGTFGLLHWLYPGGLFTQPGANGVVGILCPWYVFLFGLGTAAAALAYGPRPIKALGASRVILGLACAAGVGVLLHFHPCGDPAYNTSWPWIDALVGGFAALVLLMLGAQNRRGGRTRLHAVLSWRPLASVGQFSYSLYLIHLPLLWLFIAVSHLAVHHGVSFHIVRRCLAVFGVPLIVAAAYGFSIVFERPFLDSRLRARVLSRLWGRVASFEANSPPLITDAARVG